MLDMLDTRTIEDYRTSRSKINDLIDEIKHIEMAAPKQNKDITRNDVYDAQYIEMRLMEIVEYLKTGKNRTVTTLDRD